MFKNISLFTLLSILATQSLYSTETTKELDPYDFIYKKYSFYVNNKLSNKNFFEKTTQEQNAFQNTNNIFTQKVMATELLKTLKSERTKELREKYKKILNNTVAIIKKHELDKKIKEIERSDNDTKKNLLQEYTEKFSQIKDMIYYSNSFAKDPTDTKNLNDLCNYLFAYYEPTQTLYAAYTAEINIKHTELFQEALTIPQPTENPLAPGSMATIYGGLSTKTNISRIPDSN